MKYSFYKALHYAFYYVYYTNYMNSFYKQLVLGLKILNYWYFIREAPQLQIFLKIVGVLIKSCNRENYPKIFCVGATTIRHPRVITYHEEPKKMKCPNSESSDNIFVSLFDVKNKKNRLMGMPVWLSFGTFQESKCFFLLRSH